MASIILIGDVQVRMDGYALALEGIGHHVELCRTPHAARNRLGEPRADLVVIDVTSPDGGMGLLCGQVGAAWPGVTTLALVPYHDFSQTKLKQMGLWAPTEVLVHPVPDIHLVSTAARLLRHSPGIGQAFGEGARSPTLHEPI